MCVCRKQKKNNNSNSIAFCLFRLGKHITITILNENNKNEFAKSRHIHWQHIFSILETNYRYLIIPFSCSIYFSVEFYFKRKMIYVWVDVKVSQLCSSVDYYYSLEKKKIFVTLNMEKKTTLFYIKLFFFHFTMQKKVLDGFRCIAWNTSYVLILRTD